MLLLARYWSCAIVGGLTALLLSSIPVLFYGWEIYGQWLAAAKSFKGIEVVGNGSLVALMGRIGVPWLGVMLGIILILGLSIIAHRKRLSAIQISSLGIIGSLLASPLAWATYTMLLLPFFFSRPWTPLLFASVPFLIFPMPLSVYLFQLGGFWYFFFGSFCNFVLLMFLAQIISDYLGPLSSIVIRKRVQT
jgi:hypothetical protein